MHPIQRRQAILKALADQQVVTVTHPDGSS